MFSCDLTSLWQCFGNKLGSHGSPNGGTVPMSSKVFFIMKKKQRQRQNSFVISPQPPESKISLFPFSAYYASLVLGNVDQEHGFGGFKKKSVLIYLRTYLLPEIFIFVTQADMDILRLPPTFPPYFRYLTSFPWPKPLVSSLTPGHPSSFQARRQSASSCLALPAGHPGFDLTTTRSSFNI